MKPLIIRSAKLSIVLILSLLFLSQFAQAEKTTEIYKWVDKEGRVHYAARPGDKSAQKMHLGSRIFHKQSAADKEQQNQENNQERVKLCKDSRATLEKYKKAPFLYRYDEEKKQKVRLTEAEAKEAFMQAEKDVSYWCNPPLSETEQ